MQIAIIVSVVGAFVISIFLTGAIRRLALSHGLLDVPNARSSHNVPTPRGGGVAIVAGASVAAVALNVLGLLSSSIAAALLVGGGAIALVGFLDDRKRLSSRARLGVHFAAAIFAMVCVGGLPPMQVGERLVTFEWGGWVLGVLGLVWSLNLFNFMDGIDGIAASEASFMTFAGAGIALASGASLELPAMAACLGAACLGFLLWNWPPAKIFMGDAGSGYVGFTLAVLALVAARDNPAALLVWLILGALFFVDATVTLVRRVARRERADEAHRSHAYQWLTRRWGHHRPVTLLSIALNVLWLFPCAWLAASRPERAVWMVPVALLPIFVGALLAGAGRNESAVS